MSNCVKRVLFGAAGYCITPKPIYLFDTELSHTNHGDWVEVTLRGTVHRIWTVRVEGEGQGSVPIVLIHGMLGGSNMFLNNIDALAEQVIDFDSR